MKKVRMISAALIIMLSTVIFGMSGDGGNVPVVPKKDAVKASENVPVSQSENTSQSTKASANETVKDRLGIDTGLTKEELANFKQNYSIKFKQTFPNFTESAMNWFFDYKIDLDKTDEFEKNGLNLREFVVAQGSSYKKNALFCDVIVTGKVIELIQKDNSFIPRYKLEIDLVIKGDDVIKKYFEDIPQYLYFTAFLGSTIDNETIKDKKGIYFLSIDKNTKEEFLFLKRPYSTVMFYDDSNVCYERDKNRFDTAFKYKQGKIKLSNMQIENKYDEKYLKWYEECWIGSWDETILNIKHLLSINDDKIFYKRFYKSEEK